MHRYSVQFITFYWHEVHQYSSSQQLLLFASIRAARSALPCASSHWKKKPQEKDSLQMLLINKLELSSHSFHLRPQKQQWESRSIHRKRQRYNLQFLTTYLLVYVCVCLFRKCISYPHVFSTIQGGLQRKVITLKHIINKTKQLYSEEASSNTDTHKVPEHSKRTHF